MGAKTRHPRGSVNEDSFNRRRSYSGKMFECSAVYIRDGYDDIRDIRYGNRRIARNGFWMKFFRDRKS